MSYVNVATTNNFMSVNISSTLPPVMATCSFPSGFTGNALCRVDFTDPDGVTYTSVSTERGSAGESVTVELTLNGAVLLPSTTYYYQATLEDASDESLCVRVTGQFITEVYTIGEELNIILVLRITFNHRSILYAWISS